jgi:AAA+ ATPase superfamily predicted ATPase
MFTLHEAEGENFVDREKILHEMVTELADTKTKDGFAIYGVRRVGKTSLFKEVVRRLEKNSAVVPVYMSLWDLTDTTLEEFCRVLAEKVLDRYRPLLGIKFHATELLRTPPSVLRKISSLKVVLEDLEFLISFEGKKQVDELVNKTLWLPEKLAEKTGTKCIIMLDEFPDIIELETPDGGKTGITIVKKIRTLVSMWKRTSLCICGSTRSTMALVALSPSSPFYRQFIVREIGPLEDKYIRELLTKNLEIDERAVVELCQFSGGIPFHIQAVGKILMRKKRITIEDVIDAEEEYLREEGNIVFSGDLEALSRNEKRVLSAMVTGSRKLPELRRKLGRKISNIGMVLKGLEDKGVVKKKERGRYYLLDPVFEEWMARRLKAKTFAEEILEILETSRSLLELYSMFPERPKPSVRGTIYRLVNQGLVKRVGDGEYVRV